MIYHVESEQVALAKRITRAGFVFATTLLGAYLIHRIWFAQSTWAFGERFFDALVAAGAFFFVESRRREYDIEVTDETISMQARHLLFGIHKVRRGRIHCLRELRGSFLREPGLRLSEHGAVWAFLFGYVWIPRSLPQYEQIKTKAISWMEIG